MYLPGNWRLGKHKEQYRNEVAMKIVDMHCDTISELWKKRQQGSTEGLLENNGHIDLLRMKQSGYFVQNFALFVEKEKCEEPWEQVLALLKVYEEEMAENREWIAPAGSYTEMLENEKQGRMSALLTVEEGAVCKGELEKLRTLYDKGVRMLTLTWNYPNELGAPNLNRYNGRDVWKKSQEILDQYLNTPDTVNGLTDKGREFLVEMEKLGMIPDVSHLSDAGFYDVLANTTKPFVASHSNARSMCPCVRNLTDDMIRRLAERGGVMGLNFCADFLTPAQAGKHNPGTIEAVITHAKHIVNIGGIEVLGLGSDFDGIDTNEGLPGAQSMGLLEEELKKSGFTSSETDKIMGGNVLRLYQEVLG